MTDQPDDQPTADAGTGTGGGPADAAPASAVAAAPAFVLEAPAPVMPVTPAQADGAVPISDEERTRLDDLVSEYLDSVMSLDIHGQAFSDRMRDIGRLGDDDIRSAASVSNRLLDKPMAAMQNGGLTQTSAVSRSLVDLRHQMEDLDPSTQGDLLSPHKLLGILPFGTRNRLREYFDKYRSSQQHIEAIVTSLYQGQNELQRDNASIDQERANLWAIMERLRQYAYMTQTLDAELSAKIAAIEATDPDRARVLKEDMLFPVRQKHQDLLTQLAVSIQGYLALDIIRRNNLELVRGVQRATTVTISALRTAVIVAQALADQKLVLDQITALNSTTSNLIASTGQMLHQQSTQVNEQAASSTVEIAKLQDAFRNIYATMDEIDTFRLGALDSMQKTVDALNVEITRSQAYLDRARAIEGPAIDAMPALDKG
jgi:uncharacterized protein YaaN involved in tellurite resistance